jgi:hypothetical protein
LPPAVGVRVAGRKKEEEMDHEPDPQDKSASADQGPTGDETAPAETRRPDADAVTAGSTPPPPPAGDVTGQRIADQPAGPSRLAMVLAAVVIVAAGFLGGLLVGRASGGDDRIAGFPAGLAPGGPGFDHGRSGGGFPPFPGGPIWGSGRGSVGNGALAVGTIVESDGNTITLETAGGDRLTVDVGEGTTIRLVEEGTPSDLAEGDQVVVVGERDSDSLEASTITEGLIPIEVRRLS